MQRTLGALVVTAGLLAAAPLKADVEKGWQAFLTGDYETARAELEPAAEAGEAAAQYYLGVLYDHGGGVVRNYQTAAGWYEKAAEQGHPEAQFNLGLLYFGGAGAAGSAGALPRDTEKAARWFTPAAEAGHPMASYLLCRLIEAGRTAARDPNRALALCRTAARTGLAGAQFTTGLLLAEREPSLETWTEAYAWFLLAARANYPGAQQNLESVAKYLQAHDIARATKAADELQAYVTRIRGSLAEGSTILE